MAFALHLVILYLNYCALEFIMEEYIFFFLLKAPLYSNHVNKQDKTVILFSHVDIVSSSGMME